MKIYTKTGDAGMTSLIGARVRKDDLRVASYGDVDELSAVIGLARACAPETALDSLLRQVQRDLFAIGAQLADPTARVATASGKTEIGTGRIEELEKAIDSCEASLPPLRAFVLPGGSELGAQLHLARTVCRRAERSVVALSAQGHVDPLLLVYLNRLSDLLFVLARHENQRAGQGEDLW
jgi:cob(I)alamin adenosyltransferase